MMIVVLDVEKDLIMIRRFFLKGISLDQRWFMKHVVIINLI